MANENLRNIDPSDPRSVAAFAAAAAASFDQIKISNQRIESRLDVIDTWRSETETRLAVGAERFLHQQEKIDENKKAIADLPDTVENAVVRAMNGRSKNGNITFRWALEKVALPLLMSGAGAGAGIAIALKAVAKTLQGP